MPQPYLSLEAELHDAFWQAEDDGSEIRLMADFLRERPGKALEMGAGSGRLVIPLLEAGFDVEGLEISDDMLEMARAKSGPGIDGRFHRGDMEQWSDGRKFHSILAPAFVLQLAANPEAALRHWAGLLEPGGGLYLSIFTPYAELLGDLPEHQWYEDHLVTLPDGREGLLETRHRLDRGLRLLEREHRYSISGSAPAKHESRQSLRWFEHREMVALLGKCGFRVDGFFLDFDPANRHRKPDSANSDGIVTYHATLAGKTAAVS